MVIIQNCRIYITFDCRQLRHEFQIREKMFGKIREENEKEIATLKSIKQSLEARLLSAYDSDDVTDVAVPDPRGERIN